MMKYPWSALALLAFVYAIAVVYVLSLSRKRLRCLSSSKASIITIASAVVMVLFFGFTGISRGPVYYVVMLCLLGSMGLALASDIHHIRQKPVAAVLSHLSVFMVIAAGVFGYGDKQSARLTAVLDKPSAEAVDSDGMRVELPFMVTLHSFDIERYPAKLRLVAPDGTFDPGNALELDTPGKLGDWDVTVLESYDMAGRMPGEEDWQELNHLGAEPAAKLRLDGPQGESIAGWTACGSFMFEPSSIPLPDGSAIIMSAPAPRRFVSEISVIDSKGRRRIHELTVNHPVRVGAWRIYQSGYDMERGRWSSYSVLQCVRDPWYPVIVTGLWMTLASALVMMATAGRRKKQSKKTQS